MTGLLRTGRASSDTAERLVTKTPHATRKVDPQLPSNRPHTDPVVRRSLNPSADQLPPSHSTPFPFSKSK